MPDVAFLGYIPPIPCGSTSNFDIYVYVDDPSLVVEINTAPNGAESFSLPSGFQLISVSYVSFHYEFGKRYKKHKAIIKPNDPYAVGSGTVKNYYNCGSGGEIYTAEKSFTIQRATPDIPSITTSAPLARCNSDAATISCNTVTGADQYEWESRDGVTITGGNSTNTITISASYSGDVRVKAKATNCSKESNWSGWFPVQYGPPVISNPIQWLFDLGSNMYQCSNIITPFFYTTCTWTLVSGSATLVPNNNDCYVTTTGGALVSITASNTCGTSAATYYEIPAAEGYRMMAYPNPTKNLLTLELKSEDVSSIDIYSQLSAERVKSVPVKDFVKDNASKEGLKVDVNVGDLPRGIYYLHINPKSDSKQKVQIVQVRLE